MIRVTITRGPWRFSAAHRLKNLCDGHKCGRLHGHNYRLWVRLQGHPHEGNGMILDAGDVDAIVQPLVDRVDHRYLNTLGIVDQPTVENLAVWFWNELAVPFADRLVSVRVEETERLFAEVERTP